MSYYVFKPPAWLCISFLVFALFFSFTLPTVFYGQDSFKRPRYSDVQESIYSAKKNALRVRTDGNRQEFLSILGDVESALNSARQSATQPKKQLVLEKLQRIQPEARKALVNAGNQQSKSVRKIKSVTTSKSEVTALEKSIVRKLDPGEKPGKSFASKINPLRWFGRNRQYTKVVERASPPPKPDPWKKNADQPIMVRVPPIPLNYPTVATWSPSPSSLEESRVADSQVKTSPTTASQLSNVAITTAIPKPRKINTPKKPHRSIPIQQRSASRRISERTRDGDYRLPSGQVSKTAIPSSLTKKIKKPERKSTKVWDFGPKDNETNHPEKKASVIEWNPPSRPAPIEENLAKPVHAEVLKEVMKSSPKIQKPRRFGNPFRRIPSSRSLRSGNSLETKSISVAKSNPEEVPKPLITEEPRKFVTPKPIEQVTPSKGSLKVPQRNKPKVKPLITEGPRKFVTPKPIEQITPAKENLTVPQRDKPKVKSSTLEGSAVSRVIIVDTLTEQKKNPDLQSPVIKTETNSTPQKPQEIEANVPGDRPNVHIPSGASLSVLRQVEDFTQAMRKEEETLNERLKGIDKLLSDNADVLSEAETLLKELDQQDADQKASDRQEKLKSPSRLRIRKPSRPTPTPRVELPSNTKKAADNERSVHPPERKAVQSGIDPLKKKWGTTRRPGIRR